MEYVGIESIKKSYRDLLQNRGDYEAASLLEQKEFTDPVYEGLIIHPEIEPNLSIINSALQRIAIDLVALNSQYSSAAEFYNELMLEVLTDLENVDEIIGMEEERIQDLNIITGNISSFTSIKTLKASELSGTCSYEDEYTFMCQATDRVSVELTVEDVSGNGYEGNAYVYNNGDYISNTINSSVRNKMIDESSTSYWEYSKLNVPKSVQYYPVDATFDNVEAQCTISLSANTSFNSLRLQSDISNVFVDQLSVSNDGGITYFDTLTAPVQILESTKKYEDNSYIYGSGILCFPATNYVKLRLRSDGALNEQLAFTRVILDNVTFLNDVVFDPIEYVKEYLLPIFITARNKDNAFLKIPLSVLIGVTLARTGTKPVNVGSFNFWNLTYDSSITDQPEDNGKCAFTNRTEACGAILKYILSQESLVSLIDELPETPSNCSNQQCLDFGKKILSLISDDPPMFALSYDNIYEKYQLKKYDSVKVANLVYLSYSRYEQYFIRFDKQQDSYNEQLKQAEIIFPLKDAKRHVIRVNDITGFTNVFQAESYLETNELISTPVDCIAIFSNEYYPTTFPSDSSIYGFKDYLTYILTVNGVEYTVVPVNSHKSGIKIIRYSDYTVTEDYTVHIEEPIKSASLKVKFVTPNLSYSPYLSSLKVCLGKAVIKT